MAVVGNGMNGGVAPPPAKGSYGYGTGSPAGMGTPENKRPVSPPKRPMRPRRPRTPSEQDMVASVAKKMAAVKATFK